VEHVEIRIFWLHLMKDVHGQLSFWMGKGTHVSILTLVETVRVTLTKLDLVLFGMIKFFDTIVRTEAILSKRAVRSLSDSGIRTNLARVHPKLPSFILRCLMIVEALLRIVWIG
jgi:hypothetical protein